MIAKRAVITNIRKLDWESFNLPDKPNQHEVFLKALYSLISPGTELAIFTGKHRGFSLPNPPFPLLPSYPGYAFVGEVIAVGSKVKDIALGAKVLAEIPHGTHAIVNTQMNPVMVLPSSIREETAPLRNGKSCHHSFAVGSFFARGLCRNFWPWIGWIICLSIIPSCRRPACYRNGFDRKTTKTCSGVRNCHTGSCRKEF
jgi:hypothetical protein